jgi:hypothetical protein
MLCIVDTLRATTARQFLFWSIDRTYYQINHIIMEINKAKELGRLFNIERFKKYGRLSIRKSQFLEYSNIIQY